MNLELQRTPRKSDIALEFRVDRKSTSDTLFGELRDGCSHQSAGFKAAKVKRHVTPLGSPAFLAIIDVTGQRSITAPCAPYQKGHSISRYRLIWVDRYISYN